MAEKKVYCFCVIDRCRVSSKPLSDRVVCLHKVASLTDSQTREKEKAGCHDCRNYMERPTHGQGLYLPCPVAICQRKRGKKGDSGTDVSENLLFVVFFVIIIFQKKKFLELNYKFDIEIYSEGIRELIDRTISERYNSLQSGAIPWYPVLKFSFFSPLILSSNSIVSFLFCLLLGSTNQVTWKTKRQKKKEKK